MRSAAAARAGEPGPAIHLSPADSGSAESAAGALEAALRARAPGVHASTPLVRRLVLRLGRELGFDAETQAKLDVAACVRDVGMIALPDSVVLATKPLSPAQWALINRHPELGEQLLQELEAVSFASTIVRAHHERWDGGGYPDGLSGEAIPLLSRLIATCDAFVAIASDRPHRRGMGTDAALTHVCQESGAQFDPVTVDALCTVLAQNAATRRTEEHPNAQNGLAHTARTGSAEGSYDLKNALAAFDAVPVLAPAYERIIDAIASDLTTGGDLVRAVESDTGLTVAVLRHAQTLAGQPPIANVSDAVAALGAAGVDDAVRPLPRAAFPWRTSQLQVAMHRSLVHAQAVARATDRIARELELPVRDDILVVALLHDIGKLILSRSVPDYPGDAERTSTPEARVRQERRAWGVDHASLGGILLTRWGLPQTLVSAVAAHHHAEAQNDVATYVRLADMVAHHAQGEPVDRAKMLAVAHLCGVSADALRDILFDLPYSGGSHRRRAERSPLSTRQTQILGLLANGKYYKQIALELGVTTSTVRTHLHQVYGKLDVHDRAQAVLRATEMGWLA